MQDYTGFLQIGSHNSTGHDRLKIAYSTLHTETDSILCYKLTDEHTISMVCPWPVD